MKKLFAFIQILMIMAFYIDSVKAQDAHKPNPENYNIPVLKAIAYGITAPNAHNTQMWLVDTLSDTELLLYVNHSLPQTDPPARQIMISAGCFIELLSIGMSGEGYHTIVEYLPEGDFEMIENEMSSKPVARITLLKDSSVKKDELFNFIYLRQSNRSPYKGKMITFDEFEKIKKIVGTTHSDMLFVNKKKDMKPYLDIFSKAMEIETKTTLTNEETRHWFRFNEKERSEKRDGLSLATNGFKGMMLKIAEKSMKEGDSLTWHSDKMLKATMKNINKCIYSSKGLIFFKTNENQKIDWLKTGRDFARYNLAVAKLGLATSHYNQVVQEYPEMADLQKKFNLLTQTNGNEKIQIIVRIGRADPAYKSWRRDVESFIIKK
jgi:hypothetical protein